MSNSDQSKVRASGSRTLSNMCLKSERHYSLLEKNLLSSTANAKMLMLELPCITAVTYLFSPLLLSRWYSYLSTEIISLSNQKLPVHFSTGKNILPRYSIVWLCFPFPENTKWVSLIMQPGLTWDQDLPHQTSSIASKKNLTWELNDTNDCKIPLTVFKKTPLLEFTMH